MQHRAKPRTARLAVQVVAGDPEGSVAKTMGGRNPLGNIPRASFRTESEEFIEEEDQSQHVPFGQPPHLAFPDHVH